MGSFRSFLGDVCCSIVLGGEPALKGLDKADKGVGSDPFTRGERLLSKALMGVPAPGVVSWDRLALELSLRGLGESLRSIDGDFGGTWGGSSASS